MEEAKSSYKKTTKVELDIPSSYIAAIENSIGSHVFKNFYGYIDGEKKDILEDGRLACASFVSSILLMFGLIKERHATVAGTVEDMKQSDWHEVEEPKKGAVVVWHPSEYTHNHSHIGFYIDAGEAISNNTNKGFPTRHPWKGGGKEDMQTNKERKIKSIWWHPGLES